MNIVVLGAGTVGISISDLLCQHGHSVTVVDSAPENIERINENLDVRAILGSASQSSILFQAGISSSDVCLAVTGVDEVNIVAASMAKAMGTRRSIARVYAPVFRDLSTFDYQSHFNIDRLLSLEHLTAMELARSIRDPGSIVVENFSRGELEVNEIMVNKEGPATKKKIRDLGLPSNVRIGTIRRGNKMWIAGADDQLELEDRIHLFGRPEFLENVKNMFKQGKHNRKRVVIAGGGETGFHLARMLETAKHTVMLMEADEERCQFLANNLERTAVIHCDATRREMLEEERVGNADVFAACLGDDESNVMCGVEARDLGASQIMAIIGRPDYGAVVGKLGIDRAVSEREVMAKQVLSYLNTGSIVSQNRLPGGTINILEIEIGQGAPATLAPLAELQLPERCLVVALIQNDFIRVPGANDTMNVGDKAIILVSEGNIEAAVSNFA